MKIDFEQLYDLSDLPKITALAHAIHSEISLSTLHALTSEAMAECHALELDIDKVMMSISNPDGYLYNLRVKTGYVPTPQHKSLDMMVTFTLFDKKEHIQNQLTQVIRLLNELSNQKEVVIKSGEKEINKIKQSFDPGIDKLKDALTKTEHSLAIQTLNNKIEALYQKCNKAVNQKNREDSELLTFIEKKTKALTVKKNELIQQLQETMLKLTQEQQSLNE